MASRRKTLSHEASSDMHVVRWTRLPYLLRSRLPGTSELALNSWYALLQRAAGRLRGWRANSPGCRPRRPTHATNSLSTRKLSLHLCPGSPCREAGEPFGDTLTLFCRSGSSRGQQRRGQKTLGTHALGTHTRDTQTGGTQTRGTQELVRKRSERTLNADATARDATPRTNSTHATRSAGGRLTKPCGTHERAIEGVRRHLGTREQNGPWQPQLDWVSPLTLAQPTPPNFADVLFAFRRQGQYHFATCCLEGAAKAEKGLPEISTT